MPLNIKDPEVYQLARQVADLTGETLTDAVCHSLRERLQREQRTRPDPDWIEKLREISDRCAARPVLDARSDDELAGYDELGAPATAGLVAGWTRSKAGPQPEKAAPQAGE